jgi:hypothetical protein
MAKGMKTTKYDPLGANGITQKDQSAGPLRAVSVPSSTTTYSTFYLSGVLGDPQPTTVLTIGMGFKDVNGVYYDQGYGVSQAGRKQFNCANVGATTSTLTRAVLTAANSGTLVANQCHIRCATPTGDLFHATRITNNYVWNGDTRYRYVTVSDAVRTVVNQNRGVGIVATFTATNAYALVRGL